MTHPRRIQTLAPDLHRAAAGTSAAPSPVTARTAPFSTAPAAFRRNTRLLSGEKPLTVEYIVPMAMGHEREELEAKLQVKKRFDIDPPVAPFGTNVDSLSGVLHWLGCGGACGFGWRGGGVPSSPCRLLLLAGEALGR
ncbi:uncharacterized protein [Lolium perenne]|uniref:uncharacterized protein isoform X2 n=1 Tax=Lolium perenne TaxID=4522 RepID=UPI0021F61712|nr:cytochrome c oxidase subunit 5b-1, mitochondrial-like isoform X2 [Lolium perenne]XP_051181202.1 cytochrome c oxidase subunit 5b-1, mitochondrial-like isoform X2 [Lolium perenne]